MKQTREKSDSTWDGVERRVGGVKKSQEREPLCPACSSNPINAEVARRIANLINANDDAVTDLMTLAEGLSDRQGEIAKGDDYEPGSVFSDEKSVDARRILDARQRQSQLLPRSLRSEAILRMLLSIVADQGRFGTVQTKNLCLASGKPMTTALRYVEKLEKEGLIERSSASHDARVTQITLTARGTDLASALLENEPR